jgi:hypothetical protein
VLGPAEGRSVARQVVLGPAMPPPVADLGAARTVGTRRIGDIGALIWVAEQLDLIGHIDRACGSLGAAEGPSVGEWTVAVAIQRACAPGPKCDLADFLDGSVPRLSCLPSNTFSGQGFHRVAQQVTDEQLEQAQVAISKASVARFELSTDVLAFDTTNFDTHIDTVTSGALARRGHAKSKRRDLRVVGLGVLVSETGHVPLLYRSYAGNASAIEPRLSESPLEVGATGFCPFVRNPGQHRPPECADSPLFGLRAQLQPKPLTPPFRDGGGRSNSLGNHLALLFGERGIDVKREGVTIATECGDHEMHFVLREAGNEMYVARQAIEPRDNQRAATGAGCFQGVRQTSAQEQCVFSGSGLDVLIPLSGGETFSRPEGFDVRSLGRQSQAAAALFLRADSEIANRIRQGCCPDL